MRGARIPTAAAISMALCAASPASAQHEVDPPWRDIFDARALVGLSDADMIASAYGDGRLGPRAGRDALTVVRLDRSGSGVRKASLPVSNSVAGPPAPMALTPDRRFAIVIETRGPRPPSGDDVGLAKLPDGREITVVDLADLGKPRTVQRARGPVDGKTVSISPDGQWLVLTASEQLGDVSPLWAYRFQDGRLLDGKPVALPGWRRGDVLVDAEFAPTTRRLAVVNATRRTLTMYDVDHGVDGLVLRPWGEGVDVEKYPYAARFAPDGRHVFVNANYADETTSRRAPYRYPKGELMVIRLDAQRDPHGDPVHLITSREATARGPEALVVSPDGATVVSLDMEGTFFPSTDVRYTRTSVASLYGFDPREGVLRKCDEIPLPAVLPESAVFDRSGRGLAVASFQTVDHPLAGGSVGFWRMGKDPKGSGCPTMAFSGRVLPMPRGLMMLALP